MQDYEKYQLALDLATLKHEGQYRRGGLPYVSHPIAVADKLKQKGYGIDYIVTGLFHDLLEDTDATEKQIEDVGGAEVLKAVKLLTKTEGYVMDDYVYQISQNAIAKAVKAMDRLHNLECAVVCDDSFKRRYILETLDYYMDFDKDIPAAVKRLAATMDNPIYDGALEYEPTSSQLWLNGKADSKEQKTNTQTEKN